MCAGKIRLFQKYTTRREDFPRRIILPFLSLASSVSSELDCPVPAAPPDLLQVARHLEVCADDVEQGGVGGDGAAGEAQHDQRPAVRALQEAQRSEGKMKWRIIISQEIYA